MIELCFKQCLSQILLTSSVGGAEKGESPLHAAKRELLEETGYQVDTRCPMGSYLVDGTRGFCNDHLFLAENLRQVTQPLTNDMEECELMFLAQDEVRAAICDKQIPLLPNIAILSMSTSSLFGGFMQECTQ